MATSRGTERRSGNSRWTEFVPGRKSFQEGSRSIHCKGGQYATLDAGYWGANVFAAKAYTAGQPFKDRPRFGGGHPVLAH